MASTLKRLVILLAIAFILLAGSLTTAAQATEFIFFKLWTGTHQSAKVYTSQIYKHELSAGEGYGAVKCTTSSLTGEVPFGTAGSLWLTPSYSGCKDSFERTVHVSTNGCIIVLEGSLTIGGGGTYTGTTMIACPKEKAIVVQTTSGEKTLCTMTINGQSNLSRVYYEREEKYIPPSIRVHFQIQGLENTTSGGFFNCGVMNGTHFYGSYIGTSGLGATTFTGEGLGATIK